MDIKRLISVVIPVYNEEQNIRILYNEVTQALSGLPNLYEILFIDDGSSDGSTTVLKEIAKNDKKVKLIVLKRNYGQTAALSAGIEISKGELIITMDADLQNDPKDITLLVDKINEGYDLVLGSRVMGQCEKGALRFPVYFGNLLATTLIKLLYRFKYTDLGPFRALKFDKLLELGMHDNLGWTIEMQVKAVRKKFKIKEVPVSYRRGSGRSKLTGNIKGIIIVGYRIIWTVFKYLTWKPH